MNYLKNEKLYIFSMGKKFEVRAIIDNEEESINFMEKHDCTTLIARVGKLNFLADQYPVKDIEVKQ